MTRRAFAKAVSTTLQGSVGNTLPLRRTGGRRVHPRVDSHSHAQPAPFRYDDGCICGSLWHLVE